MGREGRGGPGRSEVGCWGTAGECGAGEAWECGAGPGAESVVDIEDASAAAAGKQQHSCLPCGSVPPGLLQPRLPSAEPPPATACSLHPIIS